MFPRSIKVFTRNNMDIFWCEPEDWTLSIDINRNISVLLSVRVSPVQRTVPSQSPDLAPELRSHVNSICHTPANVPTWWSREDGKAKPARFSVIWKSWYIVFANHIMPIMLHYILCQGIIVNILLKIVWTSNRNRAEFLLLRIIIPVQHAGHSIGNNLVYFLTRIDICYFQLLA